MKKILTLIIGALTLGNAFAQIRPSQTLQISITGVPTSEQARLNSTYPVSSSGTINMWKIGTIKASGLTETALAASIAARYKSAQIYSSPVFQVLSSKSDQTKDVLAFTVGGQVRGPGQKPWSEGMTLYTAVQAAGGETPYGAVNRVKLYRNGQVYTYNLKIEKHKTVKVYNKDLIDVPQKKWNGT